MEKKYLGVHNLNAFVTANGKRYVTILANIKEGKEIVTKSLTIETPKEIMNEIVSLSEKIALLSGYDTKGIIKVYKEEGE